MQARQQEERADALTASQGHLENWRALALRARNIETRTESYPDLAERLNTWSDHVVMEFSGTAWEHTLERHEYFEPLLQQIDEEASQRIGDLRTKFEQLYYQLSYTMTEHQVGTLRMPAFDPVTPQIAYDNLALDTVRMMGETLQQIEETLSALEAEVGFLQEFRQRDTSVPREALTAMRRDFADLKRANTEAIVLAVRDGDTRFEQLCCKYGQLVGQRSDVLSRLNEMRVAEPPDAGLESIVIEALRQVSSDRREAQVTIPDVYRIVRGQHQVERAQLFDTLLHLYQKGTIEIVLRERR